ncbi:MAG: ABC-F family ATP-binding cassette domain-containing protein [Oscillospiraceae bacterium]|nr:ABC-F family ATP-binding cassette domain-containing protein [Oscillospiraceae bacterium]
MLYAQKLSFGFPQKELFHNINFTLEKDRHCALIGSNGTGKTTLTDIIRRSDEILYTGKLRFEDVGRIGYVSQFVTRESRQQMTVFDYLSEDFLRLQSEIADICAQMENAEDLDALMERYQELLDESDSLDADNYEQNIHRQLRLAELEDKAELELDKLSGGELKLVQVIAQMLRRPGLLIMDEPDVFLDFENLNGLREIINAYRGTLLVVTHSRYLLGHCFDKIWHLENGDLQEFDGSFRAYNHSRLQKKIDLRLAAIADEEEVRRISEMVERLRDDATEVAEAQKGRALKSKVSYLGRLLARQIKPPFVEIRQPEIHLPELPDPAEAETDAAQMDALLLTVSGYSLAFDKTLLSDISFSVRPGEKVVLVGPNGTGKTSLLRDIWKRENPAIQFSAQAKPAFFSQLHAEVLSEDNTIYEEFYAIGFETPTSVQEHLIPYCFDPDSLHRKVGHLSGGEKNLLQLAKLAVSGANILLLDEPSSHLDTFSQIALEQAIAAYRGAILMVSHDFYSVVNCADTILYVDEGTIRPVRARTFRKMMYQKHFSKEYLELELQKTELETKIERCLESGDCANAQALCDKLGAVIEQMG